MKSPPGTVYLVHVIGTKDNCFTHTLPEFTDNGWMIVEDDGKVLFVGPCLFFLVPDGGLVT